MKSKLLLVIPLTLLVLAMAGCDVISPDLFQPPAEATPAEVFVPPEFEGELPNPVLLREGLPIVPVTFRVTIPADTPVEEPIQLNLMDEVTGLALNPERYTMRAENAETFAVTIEVPAWAVLKYRYTRQGDVTAAEHTSDGRPVRYRLFRVDGPSEVHDVITRWNDTGYAGTPGRIKGQVTDAQSGTPLPNILVIAGGAQAITDWQGQYLLEGLPPGVHNLVAYSMNGSYATFQQGAGVSELGTTPASFSLERTQLVAVRFTVHVPEDTIPAVPVRLAGNLSQLGNSFSDMSGGTSGVPSAMPVMTYQEDGSYQVELQLPVGTFIRYKYTLGDGLWNAERQESGRLVIRELLVPEEDMVVEDSVETWQSPGKGALLFKVTVPESPYADEFISIQFNPFGWTQPVPMWRLSTHEWVYQLNSPLDINEHMQYRYCRNGQCGSADDAATAGPRAEGRLVTIGEAAQTVEDRVDAWQWSELFSGQQPEINAAVARETGFIGGIEFQPAFHPSWQAVLPGAMDRVHSLNSEWVILSPTWTWSRSVPPVLEIVTGQDMLWTDLDRTVQLGQDRGLQVALFPTPHFATVGAPTPGTYTDLWWQDAQLDFAWWVLWFESYQQFILHHAAAAEAMGAGMLIIGGNWLAPALPGSLMADGTPSNVPEDAETRWRELFGAVREIYDGRVAWALPYAAENPSVPAFIDEADLIYVLWSPALAEKASASNQQLQDEAGRLMDSDLLPLQEQLDMPLVIAVSYPTSNGGIKGCLPAPEGGCLPLDALARPNPDIPEIPLNMNGQIKAYLAVLRAVNERSWIDGLVSRGYYPPAALVDKSVSIHGKPVETLLGNLFVLWQVVQP
jgi:hypothetical protein